MSGIFSFILNVLYQKDGEICFLSHIYVNLIFTNRRTLERCAEGVAIEDVVTKRINFRWPFLPLSIRRSLIILLELKENKDYAIKQFKIARRLELMTEDVNNFLLTLKNVILFQAEIDSEIPNPKILQSRNFTISESNGKANG